jgi:hypothetical protein
MADSQPVAEAPRGFSKNYRSAGVRAWVVTVAFGLIVLFLVLSIYHEFYGFGLVTLAEQGSLTTRIATDFDSTTAAIGYPYLALRGVAVVSFLAWLSRSVDNVPSLGGGTPMATPRWAVGWWFVPFVNFVRPYQIVNDLSRRIAVPTNAARGRLTLVWWLAWIFGIIISFLPARITVDSAQDLSTWLGLSMFGDVTELVAAVLAIAVVWQVQSRANARAAGLGQSAESTLQAEPA